MLAKKQKKLLSSLLIGMLAVIMAACSSNSGGPDVNSEQPTASLETVQPDNKPVTLKWLMRGPGKQQDSDKVWAEFNQQLQQYLPNTTVEFEPVDNAEFAERWRLIAASGGENFDLAWSGWLIPLTDEVNKGAYAPLDQLLDEYGQDLKATLPEYLWDLGKVNGQIYSVPTHQSLVDMRYSLRLHKELADKYWDYEKAEAVFGSNKYMTKEQYDIIEGYLEQLKANGEIRKGVSTFFPVRQKGLDALGSNDFTARVINDQEVVVELTYATPEFKLYYDTMRDWFQKGYIREDIISLGNDARKDEGLEDGYVIWMHQYFKNTSQIESDKFGYPIEAVPLVGDYQITRLQANDAITILQSSKNKERAMQLLNLLNTEKGAGLYNLLRFGLENEHYEKVGDNRIVTKDYDQWPTKDSRYGLYGASIGNNFIDYENQVEPEGWSEYIQHEVDGQAWTSPLIGFSLDNSSFSNELAQIRTVVSEFELPLRTGALNNHDAIYAEFIEKLKVVGAERVQQEIQRQVDEYLAQKQ